MNIDIELRHVPVEMMKYAAYNPRKDLKPGDPEYEKLKRSISKFGYKDPIIWNEATGNIVGGHQRFKVLVAEGYKEIQCSVVNLPPDEEKAMNVALNKVSGDWEYKKLSDLFEDLKAKGFDLTLTGFDAPEIEDLLGEPEVDNDDFDVDEAIEEIDEPTTKLGDVWRLGSHRLICGDCTSADTYERLFGKKHADLVVTDPPYNINYQGGTKDKLKILNDNMSDDDFLKFLTASFTQMFNIAKKGCPIYVFHSDLAGNQFRKAFSGTGWSLRQILIWVKNALVLGMQDYQWRHEPILYGWKEGAAHYFVDVRDNTTVIEDKPNFAAMKKEELAEMCKQMYLEKFEGTTLIQENKPIRNGDHPTMKPVKLIGRLVLNSSKEKDIVLDPFGGSGSTLIACEQANRVCYTSELDPKYCDVIVRRWQEFTGRAAELERTDAAIHAEAIPE